MKGRCTAFLIFIAYTAASQAYLPLNNDYELILLNGRHTRQYNFHSPVRPILMEDLEKDTSAMPGGNWFKQRKSPDSADIILNLRRAESDPAMELCSDSGLRKAALEVMPLLNFSYGMGRSGDSSDISNSAGLGIEVALRYGTKLKAVFDYLYSGNRYSDYVDEYVSATGVVPGMGEAYRKGSLYYNKY